MSNATANKSTANKSISLDVDSANPVVLEFPHEFTPNHARILMVVVNFIRDKLNSAADYTPLDNEPLYGYKISRVNSGSGSGTIAIVNASNSSPIVLNTPNLFTIIFSTPATLATLATLATGAFDGLAYLFDNIFNAGNGGYTRNSLHKALSDWAATEVFKQNWAPTSTSASVLSPTFNLDALISNEALANEALATYYKHCGITTTIEGGSLSAFNSNLFDNILNASNVGDLPTNLSTIVDSAATAITTFDEFKSPEFAKALYTALSEKVRTLSGPGVVGKGPSSSSSHVVAPSLYTDSFYPSKRSKKRKGSRTRKKYSL